MVVVGWPVVVEPGLDAFGKVLRGCFGCVLAMPKPSRQCAIVLSLESIVEGWVDADDAAQVNVVGELVNRDTFGGVRIAFKAKYIFCLLYTS